VFQALDSGHHHSAHRRIGQAVEPGGEFGQGLDREHSYIVIDRLQNVKAFDNPAIDVQTRLTRQLLSGL